MSLREGSDTRPTPARGGHAGVLMLLGSAVCYGLNIPYARMAAGLGVPGPNVVAFRVMIMLAVLAALAALGGYSLRVKRGERMQLLALSLVSAVLGLAYVSSVSFIPVAIAVLIFYTFPLLILAATPFIDHTRLSRLQLGACLCAFAGITLSVGPSLGVLDWRGLVLAFIASGAAAAQFFLGSRAPGGGGVATVFWVHVAILPIALVVLFATGAPAPLANFYAAALPLFCTVIGYLIGVALQFRGLGRSTAAAAGLIYCLEPIVAVSFAAWLLGERLSAPQYAGGALVLMAIGVSMLGASKPQEVAA